MSTKRYAIRLVLADGETIDRWEPSDDELRQLTERDLPLSARERAQYAAERLVEETTGMVTLRRGVGKARIISRNQIVSATVEEVD